MHDRPAQWPSARLPDPDPIGGDEYDEEAPTPRRVNATGVQSHNINVSFRAAQAQVAALESSSLRLARDCPSNHNQAS